MSTAISVLGGVGLFLLGMTVMTGGLKALAGSALRRVLGKAAATPLRGSFWGALVTLLVQSSSATTMTTIGLVSAGSNGGVRQLCRCGGAGPGLRVDYRAEHRNGDQLRLGGNWREHHR